MKKASEYAQHAEECRALAQVAQTKEQRDMLLNMALTWEALARDRAEYVARHPEANTAGRK